MKKFLSFILTLCMLLCMFTGFAAAEGESDKDVWLPFELSAPTNVSIEHTDEGTDSYSTCQLAWSKNESMGDWAHRDGDPDTHDATRKEIEDHGYSDLWFTAQMDWSVDNQTDWHYNKYWDTDGYDEDYKQHLGEWAYTDFLDSDEQVVTAWVFRYMGNIDDPEDKRWYGDHENSDFDGWKDVLPEGCYTVKSDDDGSQAVFDYENHTIYVRMRYLVTIRTEEEGREEFKVASEWSEVAAVGKEAEKYEPVKEGDVAAPIISDLRMTDKDFNDFPVVAFKIVVPEELTKLNTKLQADYNHGGDVTIEVEARVQGKKDWTGLQGDWKLKSGELEYGLANLAAVEGKVEKDTPIELRARYCIRQHDLDDVYTDYSEIITFGSEDMEVVAAPTPTDTPVEPDPTLTPTPKPAKEKEEKDKCGLCGFCPRPLGICIFIWLLIIIIIVVIIIVVIKMKNKEKKPEEPVAAESKPAAPEDKTEEKTEDKK